MIPRTVFGEEHEIYRETVRRFVENEVVPHHEQWEKDGIVSRDVWLAAGEAGLLCPNIPEEYGGAGADFLFSAIIIEELARAGTTGPAFYLHSDIVAPYILHYGSEEQKREWLPRMAKGEVIGAIAMTEPSAGSDLQNIKTRAFPDGNHYRLNGQKVFITNGQISDLVIVVAKTSADGGHGGMSLLVVERGMPGFERGRNLDKIGQHSADTAELFFSDVRVPATNVLGEVGRGFEYLTANLAQERLSIGLYGLAAAEAALAWTVEYTKERTAFGSPIAGFQNTKFELADMSTELEVTRPFMEECITKLNAGELSEAQAARAKLWGSELQNRVIDRCLQLFGGYGYMTEFPIGRAYVDARIATIYGGTSELMKTIISKDVLG